MNGLHSPFAALQQQQHRHHHHHPTTTTTTTPPHLSSSMITEITTDTPMPALWRAIRICTGSFMFTLSSRANWLCVLFQRGMLELLGGLWAYTYSVWSN